MPAFDKTLVLDLDKTLIYSEKRLEREPDFILWDDDLPIYPVYKRPGLDEFLRFCFRTFDVGVWGHGVSSYVDDLCEVLFREYKLKFKWSRDKCELLGNKPYIKRLKKVEQETGVGLDRIIMLDDNEDHFYLEDLPNLVKASSWDGRLNDDYLKWLPEFLTEINKVSDVRKMLGDLARQ